MDTLWLIKDKFKRNDKTKINKEQIDEETPCSKLFREFWEKINEGMTKHREDGITKSSRNMTTCIGCIIMKVRVSKHHEDGILD